MSLICFGGPNKHGRNVVWPDSPDELERVRFIDSRVTPARVRRYASEWIQAHPGDDSELGRSIRDTYATLVNNPYMSPHARSVYENNLKNYLIRAGMISSADETGMMNFVTDEGGAPSLESELQQLRL